MNDDLDDAHVVNGNNNEKVITTATTKHPRIVSRTMFASMNMGAIW